MKSPVNGLPSVFPQKLFDEAVAIVLDRSATVDPASRTDVQAMADEFQKLWTATLPGKWEYDWITQQHYGSPLVNVERALMRGRSDPLSLAGVADQSLMTPTSMRNVDAETVLIAGGNPYLHAGVTERDGNDDGHR